MHWCFWTVISFPWVFWCNRVARVSWSWVFPFLLLEGCSQLVLETSLSLGWLSSDTIPVDWALVKLFLLGADIVKKQNTLVHFKMIPFPLPLQEAQGFFSPSYSLWRLLELLDSQNLKKYGRLPTTGFPQNFYLSYLSTRSLKQFVNYISSFHPNIGSAQLSAQGFLLQEVVILYICLSVFPIWSAVACPIPLRLLQI